MPITLEEKSAPGAPVLKRTAIGEVFVGGLVKFESRAHWKEGQPEIKDDGSPRKELVVTLRTLSSTMPAGIGGVTEIPKEGDLVRVILLGGGWGDWIDATRAHKEKTGRGLQVGDLVRITTTHAIRYSSNKQELGRVSTQEELDAWLTSPANLTRKETLGRRGDIALAAPTDGEAEFALSCEGDYQKMAATTLADERSNADHPLYASANGGDAKTAPATSDPFSNV